MFGSGAIGQVQSQDYTTAHLLDGTVISVTRWLGHVGNLTDKDQDQDHDQDQAVLIDVPACGADPIAARATFTGNYLQAQRGQVTVGLGGLNALCAAPSRWNCPFWEGLPGR